MLSLRLQAAADSLEAKFGGSGLRTVTVALRKMRQKYCGAKLKAEGFEWKLLGGHPKFGRLTEARIRGACRGDPRRASDATVQDVLKHFGLTVEEWWSTLALEAKIKSLKTR